MEASMFETGLTLRPYQERVIPRLYESIARGNKRPLLVAPTGSGKTVIAAHLIERAMAKNSVVWFVAPRRELIDQTCNKLDQIGLAGSYGVLMGADKRRYSMAQIQVCSIDTLRSRMGKPTLVANPKVILVDEAHLYVTEKRLAVLNQFPDAIRIGLTATPCRFDGAGLHHLFDDIVEASNVAELTDQGYLVPAHYFSLSEPDLQRVGIRCGDFKLDELADVMMKSKLVGNTIEEWKERASDRKTVVFAVNCAHSVALRDVFRANGISAEHVDGSMPTEERNRIIAEYRANKFQVLCNCQLLQYGVDIPDLSCLVLARPTRSVTLYLQMIGRGLRPAEGKKDLLVLDHSGAVMMHGLADEPREWSLEGGQVGRPASKGDALPVDPKLITCSKCGCVFRKRVDCPACGFFVPKKPKPVETLKGKLVEVGRMTLSEQQKLFYRELLHYARYNGKAAGWCYYTFLAKFKTKPPFEWNDLEPAVTSFRTLGYIKHRNIAYAKRRANGL
jgi:superfamily II DNA or RNA helicase